MHSRRKALEIMDDAIGRRPRNLVSPSSRRVLWRPEASIASRVVASNFINLRSENLRMQSSSSLTIHNASTRHFFNKKGQSTQTAPINLLTSRIFDFASERLAYKPFYARAASIMARTVPCNSARFSSLGIHCCATTGTGSWNLAFSSSAYTCLGPSGAQP